MSERNAYFEHRNLSGGGDDDERFTALAAEDAEARAIVKEHNAKAWTVFKAAWEVAATQTK